MAPQYQAAPQQQYQAAPAIVPQQQVMMQPQQTQMVPNYAPNMVPQQQVQQTAAPLAMTEIQPPQPKATSNGDAKHVLMKAKIMSEMGKVQSLQAQLLAIEKEHQKEAKKQDDSKDSGPDALAAQEEKKAIEFVHTQEWWKKLAKSEKSPDARFRIMLREIGQKDGAEKEELYRRMLRMWHAMRESSKHLAWRLHHARKSLKRLKAEQAPPVTEDSLEVDATQPFQKP